MIIISHRGFWLEPVEKNSLAAFRRTVDEGFGTETDFRDLAGRLVISHDPPDDRAVAADEVATLFEGRNLPLAVNIKADGLGELVRAALHGRGIDWFAFDMSAPEAYRFARAGLPFFTRHSDIEPEPILYAEAAGVWLDAFAGEWVTEAVIRRHLDAGKRVCVVSSELHGRDPDGLWRSLEAFKGEQSLMLCTDRPDVAKARLVP